MIKRRIPGTRAAVLAVLLAVLISGLLSSCDGTKNKNVILGTEGKPSFVPVCAEGAAEEERQAAELIAARLSAALGCEVRTETDPNGKNRILIGSVDAGADFAEEMKEGEYGFRFSDGRLLICGKTPALTLEAAQAFLSEYVKGDGTMDRIEIPADLDRIFTSEREYRWMSLKELGTEFHRFDPAGYISDWMASGSAPVEQLLSPTGRTGEVTGDTYDYGTHPSDYQLKTTEKLTDGEEETTDQGMALWSGSKKDTETDTYITYDLEEPYYLCYYKLRPSFQGMHWEFEYSEDGEEWMSADSYTEGGWIHARTFSDPLYAQYVRFHITRGSKTGNDFFIAIREIWLQGIPASAVKGVPSYIAPVLSCDAQADGKYTYYYDYSRTYVTVDLGAAYDIAEYAFEGADGAKDVRLLAATDPTVWNEAAKGTGSGIDESGRRYLAFSAKGVSAASLEDIRIYARPTESGAVRTVRSGNTDAAFVMPAAASGSVLTDLGGAWEICTEPVQGFWREEKGTSGWKAVTVPGYPETQGFKVKGEKGELNHEYAYRKTVPSPLSDGCDRYFLRFDSVLNLARVWVNGTYLGSHSGGYCAFEFEITDQVRTGKDLEIVVGVTEVTYAPELNIGGSGITGAVTLCGTKDAHLTRLHTSVGFDEAYENAVLTVGLAADPGRSETLTGEITLTDPDGKAVTLNGTGFSFGKGETEKQLEFPVTAPQKWDAEHPRLYTLRVTLGNGTVYEDKIGFRAVELTGKQLLVNGSPVKLRGVDWTDVDPNLGLVSSPVSDAESLIKLKAANVNYLRMAHFPPSDAILDLCDELGFYVELEATQHINTHWAADDYERLDTISNPAYLNWTLGVYSSVFERTEPHASIIIWSVSNESDYGGNTERVCDYLDRVDPSRPVKYSWGDAIPADSWVIDIKSVHYPSLASLSSDAPMPTIYDEIGHLYYTQNVDPGFRALYGVSFDDYWEAVLTQKGALGCAIWHSRDFMFFGEDGAFSFNTTWGLLDCWNREKPEYYSVKKAYSPLNVDEMQVLTAGADGVRISVGNRYYHTDLSELVCVWACGDEHGETPLPSAAPGKTAYLVIPVKHAKDGDLLHLDFVRRSYEAVENYVVDSFEFALGGWTAPVREGPADGEAPEMQNGSTELLVSGESFSLIVTKATGKLIAKVDGKTVLSGVPVLTLNGEPQTGFTGVSVQGSIEGNEAVIVISGRYPSGKKVTFTLSVDRTGRIGWDYAFTKSGSISESGVILTLNDTADTLTWSGRPVLWSCYPDDHIGRISGTAKRDYGLTETYGVKPEHPWSQDASAFDTGMTKMLSASRDFTATRFGVDTVSLTEGGTVGVTVETDNAAVRASVSGKTVSLTVLDSYSALGATDQMGDVTPIPLKKGPTAEGSYYVGSFVLRLEA